MCLTHHKLKLGNMTSENFETRLERVKTGRRTGEPVWPSGKALGW